MHALPVRRRLTSPSTVPIEQLQLTVMRRLDGLLAGDHAGLFPGHGTERGEARPYIPGDDPRHIDWAVTARTGDAHVRDTIADHELELWLVLDSSTSHAFGTGRSSKHELGWSAAGAFALLAGRGGNRVGAVTSGRDAAFIPARPGRAHVAVVLSALHSPPVEHDPGNLAGAINKVRLAAKRRGMVVVVSDFHGEPEWERPLRAISARHDLIAVQVADAREMELTDVGQIAVVDPETGRRRLVDTADASLRTRYREAATRRQAILNARLAAAGADHLSMRTDRDWVVDLVRFVTSRRTRRQAARAGVRPLVRS